ncbi:MAG: hypothetical protein AAEJ52_02665 [Myxococcota bacterium]
MPGTQQREKREVFIFAAGLLLAVLTICVLFYPHTQEDAYITFRYSQHLAQGFGVGAWNLTTEPVEGYTPALWMFGLGAGAAIGLRIETLAKLVGIAAQLGLCGLLVFFPWIRNSTRASADALHGGDRDVFLIAALSIGLYLPACFYATSGMEATSFAFLVGLALLVPICSENALVIGLIFAALVSMRPEGALIGGIFALLHALLARIGGRPIGASVGAFVGLIGAFAALTAFRLAWFGELVPNTYFAKTFGGSELLPRLGLVYLSDWATHHLSWAVLLAATAAGLVVSIRRRGITENLAMVSVLVLAGVYVFYVYRVGGDNPTAFPWWRQLLHLGPAFALIVGFGICTLTRNRPARFALAAIAIVSTNYQVLGAHHGKMSELVSESLASFPSLNHAPRNAFYVWLSEISDSQTVIASAAAGELPFVVDAIHIDMLGLNDREIAHRGRFDPDGPIDSKSDIDSVMRRRPDIIQSTLRSRRFEQVSPRGNRILHRGEMEAALLNHPSFVAEYLFVRNAPYEAHDRALFLRRDYWANHPRRDLMDCIPVLQTAIYPPRSISPSAIRESARQ